ncbi:methionyl-tRNA formyltransferase [Cephaloticoccus primus]|uniref:Methionyl-tRNA formyltransferase n=1 Tax=Cephaloticoccus primus TaxID=1548207 RepID=A0A139SPQ1_9BACT|nr:methionyl-tRNA formyltransferase [Cephaloticoccus primus]KXU36431.1 methionyl-tRNA formyltransferase [Cephaloticoccus primus]
MPALRLVFLGSDPIALPLLDWLVGAEGRTLAEVVGVFTQPDRAVGRGQKVRPNEIKQWARAHGLPVYQPEKLDAVSLADLAALRPDLSLVMAYGHILREDFIAAPRLGTLNLHASILPAYRGASPIQTAVASGEKETGLSLMRIVRELDAGPVADVERVPVAPLNTALDVEAKLAVACVPLIARNLPALAAGELVFREQAHERATFCRRLKKSDGVLDFFRPAAELAARINGLFPWPACSIEVAGKPIKCGLAEALPAAARPEMLPTNIPPGSATPPPLAADAATRSPRPGTVIGADSAGLLIATGQGTLRLLRLQRPGGQMLPASEFLRGNPIRPGTQIPSLPAPALVSPA